MWDEKGRRYVDGRTFSGYSEYRGTHAREQGKAHDREEQQRNTVVFSADDFGFAREHVRRRPPRLVTTSHARMTACCLLCPVAQIPELDLLVRAAYNKLPSSFDEDGSPVEATHAHALCQAGAVRCTLHTCLDCKQLSFSFCQSSVHTGYS